MFMPRTDQAIIGTHSRLLLEFKKYMAEQEKYYFEKRQNNSESDKVKHNFF